MADDKAADKGKKKKSTNVKIYARVRSLMPWEPRKVSLSVKGNKVRNKTEKTTNEYLFQKVFNVDITNEQIFTAIVEPMIDNVLNGFNAILIAYGQTGSGKTYSMLGKPNLNIVGLLPYMLKLVCETPSVHKLELAAVEAFGHHVARIELFDLFDPENQIKVWAEKKGNTGLDVCKARTVQIKSMDDAYEKIRFAHGGSHFAPTGKNPESSRGHVTFIATVHQSSPDDPSADLISHFVMVDCAGSEGESAFTKDFIASCDKTTLMARRLEAGCINTGLSQLQIIFNELRYKGKLSKMLGNGLRRVLHPFVNNRTFLSVLFTFSPSVNNSKPTESTLKFAVTAGMVKVKPVKQEAAVNVERLVQQLRKHIEENDKLIDEQNDKITDLKVQLVKLQQEGISAGNLAEDDLESSGDEVEVEDEAVNLAPSGKKRKRRKKMHHESTLPTDLLAKLQALDEDESSEDEEPLDEMFTASKTEVSEQDIEQEMQAALSRMNKVADAGDVVRHAVDVNSEEKSENQTMDALGQLASTLAAASADPSMTEEEEEQQNEDMAAMGADLSVMDETELIGHCDQTLEKIDETREEQHKLKSTQQNMVDHLVETNEWLFSTLNSILTE